MNVIIRKRQIIMSALVLALGSAVFVNWYFTRPDTAQTSTDESISYSVIGDAQYVSSNSDKETISTSTDNQLTESRLARSKAHDEAFEKLKEIINDPTASKSAVDQAAKQLARLTDTIKLEADVEALVEAKCNFSCVVLINSEKAEVVCDKGALNSTSILQIKEIIIKHTSIKSENITIFETK